MIENRADTVMLGRGLPAIMAASIILPLLLIQLAAVAAGLVFIQRLPEQGKHQIVPPIPVIVICCVMAIFVFALSEPSAILSDFRKAYYSAGRAVLGGPAPLSLILEQKVGGFVNLPILAYLFAPFALMPPVLAAGLFSAIGLAMVVGAWLVLVQYAELEGSQRWTLLFLFAASGPLHNSVKEGNTSHMVLLALAAGLCLLRAHRNALAGAVLAAAALVKLPFLLFAAYFALRRNWTAFLAFSAVCTMAGLLSLAVFGWAFHVRWFELSILEHTRNSIGSFNDQSIRGFMARIFGEPSMLFQWVGRPQETMQYVIGTVAIGFIYISAILVGFKRSPSVARDGPRITDVERDLEYQLILVIALVTSPISWTHYYTWLLIPIALNLGPNAMMARSPVTLRLAWIGIFLTLPIVSFVAFSSPLLAVFYAKFGVSHVLMGGLIWFGLLVWARAQAAQERAAGGRYAGLSQPGGGLVRALRRR